MARCITRRNTFDQPACRGVPARKGNLRPHANRLWNSLRQNLDTQKRWTKEITGNATSSGPCLENLRSVQAAAANGVRPIYVPESGVQRIIETMDGRRRRPRSENWLRIRDALILEHMDKVEYEAIRMSIKMPASINIDDLMGPAIVALIERAEHYIPMRGKFWNYAVGRIQGAMKDWMRKEDWIPRTDRAKYKKAAFAGEDFRIRLQFHLTSQEDTDIYQQLSFIDTRFKQIIDRDFLEKIMRGFSAQERQLVNLRIFDGLTMKETGIRMGITESRVCQLWSEILLYARSKANAYV